MTVTPPPESDGPDRGEREAVFTGASTLFAMLTLFGVIGLLTLLATIGPPAAAHLENEPAVAHQPSDFPEIFEAVDELVASVELESGELFQVPPPPFREPDLFPCSSCHEGDSGDSTRRELFFHENIVLDHDEEHRWCLDCHLDVDRDQLHLADGAPLPFAESFRLCGQCHGTQFRDWRAGAHGRRVGFWDGAKGYLLCVNCHYPHAPGFEPVSPLPPPVSPQHLRQASESVPATEGEYDATP